MLQETSFWVMNRHVKCGAACAFCGILYFIRCTGFKAQVKIAGSAYINPFIPGVQERILADLRNE